jgi:hypothetical protein
LLENQGAQTTHFGRYDWPALAGDGVAGAHSGSRWWNVKLLGQRHPDFANFRLSNG